MSGRQKELAASMPTPMPRLNFPVWEFQPGDRVTRMSPIVYDLGLERIARVEVMAEVDFQHAEDFWPAPVRRQLLSAFVSHGAKAVIATNPKLRAEFIGVETAEINAVLGVATERALIYIQCEFEGRSP